jgi:hypothetical protein
LAVDDGNNLSLLNSAGDWTSVGMSGTPVWSPDGRYLAWSPPDDIVFVDPPFMNAPWSAAIYLLDTITGRRLRYRSDAQPLSGWLLATSQGFVAPLSGRNNLGNDATDFVILRFDDLADGRRPRVEGA